MFYFGMNSEKFYEMKDETPYKVCKYLKAFHKVGWYEEGSSHTGGNALWGGAVR